MIEVKTIIADIQGLLRPLDSKGRLARDIAREIGWEASVVVPCLVVAEESTSRRRIARHAPLFAGLSLRGRAARLWLASPTGDVTGVLLFLKSSDGTAGAAIRAGRQRVRRRVAASRSS